MDWTRLSPEEAAMAYGYFISTGDDPTGIAFAMMTGDTRASDLVNAAQQARTGQAVAMRAADPIGYDVDTLISNYYLKPGLSEALRAFQRANNLTDQQMLDAMARSPLRSNSTAAQNLNLLRGSDDSATPIAPPLSPTDVKAGVTTPLVTTRQVTPTPVTPTPVTPTPVTPTPASGSNIGFLIGAAALALLLG